jgi:hypothetical protein
MTTRTPVRKYRIRSRYPERQKLLEDRRQSSLVDRESAIASSWLHTKKEPLATFGQLSGIRSHKPQHLLLQLRIHLVSYRYNVSKEQAEIQTLLVFVQH